MRGRTSALKIEMDTQTRKTLLSWLRRQKTPAGLAKRARAMLLLADGQTYSHTSKQVGLSERHLRKWAKRFITQGISGLYDSQRPGRPRFFPPQVALYLVKLACELPESCGRSLSQWDCTELASQLVAAGVVNSISPSTIKRILIGHRLKPWRHHLWLSPKVPRDATFAKSIREISSLYTRSLTANEMVLCVDEKTSLQPRPRQAKTLPAQPGVPVRVEQWFSILQRKRLRIANFADKEVLAERLQAFIAEWNALAKRGVSPSHIRLIGRERR